ncbi:MAG: hypothetical protein ACQCN6_08910 [Candidatus Bathyarchaeia archaeon]
MVAEEDKARELKDFDEGFERYRSLLIRVAKMRPFDMMPQAEGPAFYDVKQVMHDLAVLERAHLLKGELKETARSEYHQYDLTAEGEQLVEKLSKET